MRIACTDPTVSSDASRVRREPVIASMSVAITPSCSWSSFSEGGGSADSIQSSFWREVSLVPEDTFSTVSPRMPRDATATRLSIGREKPGSIDRSTTARPASTRTVSTAPIRTPASSTAEPAWSPSADTSRAWST